MPAPRPRPRPVPPRPAAPAPVDEGFSLDLGTDPAPLGQRTQTTLTTRAETASEAEIDNQLDSLTTRTSLEELARAGKTRNLKTLSERNLKEWIKEALRRVISSSATTLGADEQERLLKHTREELSTIMRERSHEADTRSADAERLATVSAERDALAMRLAALEVAHADRLAEWEQRATDAAQRRDALAARNAQLEAQMQGAERRAETALEVPLVDDEVLASLRAQLARERERALALEAERSQLQRTVSKRLVASAEVVAGLLALDRRVYGGAHHASMLETSTDPEAAFFADERAAQAVISDLSADLDRLHGQLIDKVPDITDDDGTLASDLRRIEALEWTRVQDSLIDDLQDQLADAEARLAQAQGQAPAVEHTIDPDEMAQLRGRCGELQSKVHRLEDELADAKRTAALAREAVARLLREQDKHQAETGTITQRITAAESRQAAVDRRQTELQEHAAAAERQVQELRAALARAEQRAADAERAAAEARKRVAQAETVAQGTQAGVVARAETAERQLGEIRAALAAAQRRVEAQESAAAEARAQAAAEHQAAQAASAAVAERARRQAGELATLHQRVAQADAERAEHDRVRRALAQAERARDGLSQDLERARTHATPTTTVVKPVAAAPTSETSEVTTIADLRHALTRARAVVTDAEGAPREDAPGALTAMRKGNWLTVWADRKGRLKVARTVGNRWVTCGRSDTTPSITEVVGSPQAVMRGDVGQVVWRDAAGQIQMLALDRKGRQLAVPTLVGTSPHAPALARGGGTGPLFIVTVNEAGHILLHDEGASVRDLTILVECPPAVGPASAWLWALEGSRHCAYRAADGSIHELLELQGTWYHADLSAQTGAPPAAADPLGYAPADHEHVLYLGADGHVHELCFDSEQWIHHDLTAAANAPAASGRPSGGYLGGRHTVVYRGVDGAVHLLRLRRDWRHQILSEVGLIAGDAVLAASGDHGALAYTTAAGEHRWARLANDASVHPIGDFPH